MLFLLQGYSGYTSGLELAGLLIAFIIVIVACYFVTKFIGGKQLAQQKNSNFTVLDTFRLAQNKYLQLIQAGNRYFVLAICKDSIRLIAELEKEDITYWRENGQMAGGFQELLSAMHKKQKNKQTEEPEEKDPPEEFPK